MVYIFQSVNMVYHTEFGEVARYKINAQKSLAFLCTNDEISEREIKETLPFTTATKRIKYLGINLPKEDRKRRRVGKECRSRWSPYH